MKAKYRIVPAHTMCWYLQKRWMFWWITLDVLYSEEKAIELAKHLSQEPKYLEE